MAFETFGPLSIFPTEIFTSNNVAHQIWQELVRLRFAKKLSPQQRKGKSIWVDQGRTYFLDAMRSDWRSSGLLYYYSFLNLAKTTIFVNRLRSYRALDTIAMYHGLDAPLQKVANIGGYMIHIHPKQTRKAHNLFPYFYEAITGQIWPFKSKIKIELSQILPYCAELTIENKEVLNLNPALFQLRSVVRYHGNQLWFELPIDGNGKRIITENCPGVFTDSLVINQLTQMDFNDWFNAFRVRPAAFRGLVMLRTQPDVFSDQTFNSSLRQLHIRLQGAFKGLAIPDPNSQVGDPHYLFCPKIGILGSKLLWHPLLSEYLFSFALSAILRYQPQILANSPSDAHIAEAWCRQDAILALKHFLLYLKDPPIVVKGF